MKSFKRYIAETVFTRQHYETIAGILSRYRRPVAGQAVLSAPDTVRVIAQDLADFFEQDNPNFDRNRFLLAVQKRYTPKDAATIDNRLKKAATTVDNRIRNTPRSFNTNPMNIWGS